MDFSNDDTPVDSLAHYGVKGMRWGIRKKDDLLGRDSAKEDSSSNSTPHSVEAYKAVAQSKAKNPTAELRKNVEKFISKTDPNGDFEEPLPMTLEQKRRLAKIAVGTLAVGAVVGYSAYKMQQPDFRFNMKVTESKLNSWSGTGFVKDSSWNREGFTLPAGHTFNRISRAAEDGFRGATYSTHSVEDFHRYVVGFRKELGPVSLQHITWKATAPVRVPNLAETLDGLRVAMDSEYKIKHGPAEVLDMYNSLSGGKWDSDLSKSFFSVLKERGFSAIVDEMDAGVIGETPLVLFNTDIMGPKTATPLGSEAIKRASSLVSDFPKPPRK